VDPGFRRNDGGKAPSLLLLRKEERVRGREATQDKSSLKYKAWFAWIPAFAGMTGRGPIKLRYPLILSLSKDQDYAEFMVR